MHVKRLITGIVALPFLILLIWRGGPVMFAVFVGIVSILAFWEYFRIVLNISGKTGFGAIPVLGLITCLLLIWSAYMNSPAMITGFIMLNLIVSGLFSLLEFKSNKNIIITVAWQVLGLLYIPLSLSFLVMIRNGDCGIEWIFLLLSVVFAGDTGAFYVGTFFGRHKLCPSISPAKTIEGSVAGLAANLCAGAVFKYLFLPSLPWGLSLVFFLSAGIAGQAGDLFESEFKRSSNIKDSGAILPGHGGVLDRIDALLFAAPLAYFFKVHIL